MDNILNNLSDFATAFGTGTSMNDVRFKKQQQLMQLDEQRKGALFKDARMVNSYLKAGQPEQAANLLTQRAEFIQQLGGDPSDTLEPLSMIQAGDTKGAMSLLDSVEMAGVQSGYLQAPEKPNTGKITANIADYLFLEQLKKEGKVDEAEAFANKSGLSKLDPEQAAELAVKTSRLKEQDKKKATRLSGFVDSGVGAADSVGNMRRALSLLDTVKTGGFNNVALKAKQMFGIEGADEGELSNNLGKAVLSQLRATFGAAFTAKEGEQLQSIESGFGKSAATNKRLLKNALKVATRAAKRGVRAAKELGDDFSADEIGLALESALNNDFNFDSEVAQPNQPEPSNADNSVVNWSDL